VNLKITDTTGNRFTVPKEVFNDDVKNTTNSAMITDFVTISDSGKLFSLTIHEHDNEENVYFRIDQNSLLFSDYFLSLETNINTNGKLYGIGERVHDFFIGAGIYTSWARDIPDPIEDGLRPGKNVYGTHPVYFTQQQSGNNYHWGMANMNAGAQDTKVEFGSDLGGKISHYITGTGIFDMYFFLDHSVPEDAVKSYHDLIGYPLLPPYWGLGWHQCKYGYESTENLREVFGNYTLPNKTFPLDVLWSDIDYMDRYRDFTYDKEGAYKDLDDFVTNKLQQNDRHYVPIIDAGIAIDRNDTL
jgi:alpha-glucosidase (family GH31 glycosyl hydrolase)